MALEPPTSEDCCNSGCNPCVFDVYKKYLEKSMKIKKEANICNMRYDLLSVTKCKCFKLIEKTQNALDIYLFTFQPCVVEDEHESSRKFEDFRGILPINPGQHVVLKCKKIENSEHQVVDFITRSYTPVSLAKDVTGCTFKLVIKLYKTGLMSTYLRNLQAGDLAYFRGPYGSFNYVVNKYKLLLMICMGTGVAPVIPIVQLVLNNDEDETIIRLLYGCCNVDSIIMRKEFKEMTLFWNFSLSYFISGVYNEQDKQFGETFKSGRINKQNIFEELQGKELDKCFILICGCGEFNSYMLNSCLEIGMVEENIHVFS